MKKNEIKISSTAPRFTLTNQDGNKISLKSFFKKKNVVLYFYPRALTPGCNTQACGIRDSKNELARLDTVVLGISTDPQERLMKFKQKKGLNFDLLSDEDHKIADKYGVWQPKKFMGQEFLGVKRVTFIIGKDGKIKHIIPKVNTKTHHQDIITFITENLK